MDQVFDEMGAAKTSSDLQSDFGFAGRTWDDKAALYYNRARWYEPNTGRFISEDPARDGSNSYAYADNNPVNYVDPFGLSVQSPLNNLFGPSTSSSFGINSGPISIPSGPSNSFGLNGGTLTSTSSFSFSSLATPAVSRPVFQDIDLPARNFDLATKRQVASVTQIVSYSVGDYILGGALDSLNQNTVTTDNPTSAFFSKLVSPLVRGAKGILDIAGPASTPSQLIEYGDGSQLYRLNGEASTGAYANQAALFGPPILGGTISTLNATRTAVSEVVALRGSVPTGAVPQTAARTNAQLVDDIGTRAGLFAQRSRQQTAFADLSPQTVGIKQHDYADRLLTRYQRIYGDRGLRTEISVINGRAVTRGTAGSVRLDVLEGNL